MTRPAHLLVLLLIGSLCRATEPGFARIGREQGLSHLTITGIYQDRRGFVWIGTIDGLNRFDGYRSIVYRADPDDPESLSSSFIHGMLEDAAGNLWVTTRNAGFSVLAPENRETGRFHHYPIGNPEDPASENAVIYALTRDSLDRLWVGSDLGLSIFDEDLDRFVPYPLPEPGPVGHVLADAHGRLWLSTPAGLLRAEEPLPYPRGPADRPEVRLFTHEARDLEGLDGSMVSGLQADPDGGLWVAYFSGVVRYLDPRTGRFQKRVTGFAGASPRASCFDTHGRLWITTDGAGTAIYDPDTESLELIRHDPRRSDSISHDYASAITRSRDGTMWVGTWGGGLNRAIDETAPIPLIRHDPGDADSLGFDFVLSVLPERGGTLYVGTARGLSRRGETGHWSRFRHDPDVPTSLPEGSIWCLLETQDGEIWVGSQRGGIGIVDGDRFRAIRHDPQRPDSLIADNIKALFQTGDGTIWVGSEDRGMASLAPEDRAADRWQRYRFDPADPAGLSHDTVRCFAEDRDGSLWVGTLNGGLNRLGVGRSRFRRFPIGSGGTSHADIRGLTVARDGSLWIATYGGGLNHRDPGSGRFSVYRVDQGLANDFTYGILEDSRGDLWISTNQGISCFDPAEERFTNYTTAHGLQSDEFNTGAYARASDGTLYFGGIRGLNYFQPESLRDALAAESGQPPPVALTALRRMGEPVPIPNDTLELDHDDKYFHFEMAVLDYRDPDANRYAYKLEGFDRDWVENDTRNYAGYTNLDPGRYSLRYRGANSRGVWNEGEPLAIRIRPPFWMTHWFALLCLVTLGLTAYGATRIRAYYKAYRGTRYVGRFELLETLGEGGSGTVYLARDRMSKHRVALKVLHANLEESKDGIRRFLQEAEIGSRLDHPNIVRIYEAGSHEGTRYISMAYLPGETLKDHIKRTGPMDEARIRAVLDGILAGLAEIHAQSIVHRDLKSANIMITEGDRIVIMDFGLARISTLTTMNNRELLMGTLAYMSPEQTLGKTIDARADIYALGVILYEMRFGRLPFPADNEMELIYAIHNEQPSDLDAGNQLDQHIARCLAKDPAARPQAVGDLREAMASTVESVPGSS